MSEYLVTLIPGSGNGTHGLYLMWPKAGVGELYEGNMDMAAESSSRGVTVLDAGIAVHDVTVGELLDSVDNDTLGEYPRLRHTIGAEESHDEEILRRIWSNGLAELNHDPVYNMLITTLFLMFVLTTLALLIFLLMRRPICCSNCRDPLNEGEGQAQTDSQQDEQDGITYLVETHGVVMKKRMWDSPPPYESPPDYLSLSPEIIMNAKKLYHLNASNNSIATLTSKTMHNVMPMVHCTNSPTLCGHGKESPVSTTPLVAGTGAIPPFPENRKISLPYPPNKPPRLNRALSSPSSMPPTPVIQPPPHYDTIQAIIEEQQKSETINIDKSSTKS
ncbi:unnamed protein product [Meganyctiphanes norvegica]|uniref:Uncharacterized protein n=1 Tax=Meganyctiphanes norvegica TaxID=48144 RepID=A0AAV2S2P6_MEGNR